MITGVGRGFHLSSMDYQLIDGKEAFFPKHLLKNFDVELQTFFHDVICGELDLSAARNATSVRQALKEVVHAYKKGTVESNASNILYDTPEKRCAYMLKHCACFGSGVARHFLRLLRSNPTVMRSALLRRRIEVCCLGGGPGTEAVGVAKVIGALESADVWPIPMTGGKEKKLEIVVRVLDISGHWKSTVESVLKALNRSDAFFDRDRVVVRFAGLIETDLTDCCWEERVKKAVGEADLVTMVYFVSAVNGGGAWRNCVSMLKNIVAAVKPGCVLFFLDSAKELHYGAVQSAACRKNSQDSMALVHGPYLQEFHTLSGDSIGRYMELYLHRLGTVLCLTNCFVACAAWAKLDNGKVHPAVDPCPCCYRISGRDWRKLQKCNTRKQEVFRQWVERLVLSQLNMDFAIDDEDPKESTLVDSSPVMSFRTLYATKSKQKRIVVSRVGKIS